MSDDAPVGRPVFTVDSKDHYVSNDVNISCAAGAINVILLPTQTFDNSETKTKGSKTYKCFKGTKLVPLPPGELRAP